jgi:hypothetical protein
VAINVAQLDSFGVLALPRQVSHETHTFLYEGNSWEEPLQVAERFEVDGTAVEPAPFLTDSGGWEAQIVMEGSTLPVTVDNPLADDGIITLRLARGASDSLTGKHWGELKVLNPVGGPYTKEKTITRVLITITEKTST